MEQLSEVVRTFDSTTGLLSVDGDADAGAPEDAASEPSRPARIAPKAKAGTAKAAPSARGRGSRKRGRS